MDFTPVGYKPAHKLNCYVSNNVLYDIIEIFDNEDFCAKSSNVLNRGLDMQ